MTTHVANYGGGIQTAAMMALIARGVLPRPDHIVMADTGREIASTWRYLHQHMAPFLASHGLHVDIAPHALARYDLDGPGGTTLLPVFTQTGKLRTFCAANWKRDVIAKWLRAHGVRSWVNWLGISLDERTRATVTDGRVWYPLIDLMLTRADCEAIVLDAGLPLPRKSRCFMCPHQSNAEWQQVRDEEPGQWEEALAIDADTRAMDTQGGVYLHRDLKPLAMVNIETPDRKPAGRQCGLGLCWM